MFACFASACISLDCSSVTIVLIYSFFCNVGDLKDFYAVEIRGMTGREELEAVIDDLTDLRSVRGLVFDVNDCNPRVVWNFQGFRPVSQPTVSRAVC